MEYKPLMMYLRWKRAKLFYMYLVWTIVINKANGQFEEEDEDDEDTTTSINGFENNETASTYEESSERSTDYNLHLPTTDVVNSITGSLDQTTINESLLLNTTENNSVKSTETIPAITVNSSSTETPTQSSTMINSSSSSELTTAALQGRTPSNLAAIIPSSNSGATTNLEFDDDTFPGTSYTLPSPAKPVLNHVAVFNVLPISSLSATTPSHGTVSPDSVLVTRIYEKVGLTILCSSEILTINEDFSHPNILRSIHKEYAISFEIPGDEENTDLHAGITSSSSDTKEYKIFDNNTKLNKTFTFVKGYGNETFASWTNRTTKCDSGPSFTQQTWQYINSNRKKIEIKVNPLSHSLNIVEPLQDVKTMQSVTENTEMNFITDSSTMPYYTPNPNRPDIIATTESNSDKVDLQDIIPNCPEYLPYEKFYDPDEGDAYENYDYTSLQNEIDEKFKGTPYENCPVTEIKWIKSQAKKSLSTSMPSAEFSTSPPVDHFTEVFSTTEGTSTIESTSDVAITKNEETTSIPDIHQLHLNVSVELDHIVTGYYRNGTKKNEIDIISRDFKDFTFNETEYPLESYSLDNKLQIGFVKDADNLIKIAFDIPPDILSEIKEKVIDSPQHSLFGKEFIGDTHVYAVNTSQAPYSGYAEKGIIQPGVYDTTPTEFAVTEEPTLNNIPKIEYPLNNDNNLLPRKYPKLLRLVQEVPSFQKEPIRQPMQLQNPTNPFLTTTPEPPAARPNYYLPLGFNVAPPPSPPINYKLFYSSVTPYPMMYQSSPMSYSNNPGLNPLSNDGLINRWELYKNRENPLPFNLLPLNYKKREYYQMPNPYNEQFKYLPPPAPMQHPFENR